MSKIFQTKNKFISILHSKDSGLSIHIGYECGNSCNCKFKRKCKYAHRTSKNIYYHLRTWILYKFNIQLPLPRIHFGRNWTELSGTVHCPFGTTVEIGCHKCIHCCGIDENYELLCGLYKNEGRQYTTYDDEYWRYQCKDFTPYKDN